MKKQVIDEFILNNKFLLVPRLVNQKLFDELCPVKQFHRRRKILMPFVNLQFICEHTISVEPGDMIDYFTSIIEVYTFSTL